MWITRKQTFYSINEIHLIYNRQIQHVKISYTFLGYLITQVTDKMIDIVQVCAVITLSKMLCKLNCHSFTGGMMFVTLWQLAAPIASKISPKITIKKC